MSKGMELLVLITVMLASFGLGFFLVKTALQLLLSSLMTPERPRTVRPIRVPTTAGPERVAA